VNPPSGTWQFVIVLKEKHGSEPEELDNSLQMTPLIVAPQPGLWWSKAEPGRGYTLDYRHGMLVVTTYAYQQGGAPQWYLSAGPLNGGAFAGTLDKYTGGQCIHARSRARARSPGTTGRSRSISHRRPPRRPRCPVAASYSSSRFRSELRRATASLVVLAAATWSDAAPCGMTMLRFEGCESFR